MQTAVIASLNEDFLKTTVADSDRFVYSNYVMPVRITFDDGVTPILPDYKRHTIEMFASAGAIDGQGIRNAMDGLDFGDVASLNRLELSSAGESSGTAYDSQPPTHSRAWAVANALRSLLPGRRPAETEPTLDEMIEFFIGLLESDTAYFFLDRTRIRPSGFRVGEHVFALSLLPGEEVTLEQKTYSKREMTFEEQNEQESQFDLELSSSLSTELQEGFSRQKSASDTWGLNVSKTGSYSSPIISDVAYGSFNTNHTIAYTKNVTEADQETRSRSTKDSATASAKVASKYRTTHKTSFKVATEQVFEATSKRVVRNPNAFTPITAHYFKILQFLEMKQERYGVRLGWTPFVKDPAAGFFEKLRDGKAKILSDAEVALPPKPEIVTVAQVGTAGSSGPSETWKSSAVTDIGEGALDGSISMDLTVDVEFGDDWEWDGSIEKIDPEKMGNRPKDKFDAYVKGVPLVVKAMGGTGSALRVVVHVGSGGDPGLRRMMQVQVHARFVSKPVQTVLPTSEQAAEQAAEYSTALRDWETKCEELRVEAQKAANDWEAAMLSSLNPVAEIVDKLIKDSFPTELRGAGSQIDLWQKLFEWERASYVAYPGWWANGPLRDPTRDPSEFINASWARLYLPVRVGMERLALRWMHRSTTRKLDAETESRFDAIEAELKTYRTERFGGEHEMADLGANNTYQEKYDTIASWTDLMPTDGTHVEVIQGYSMAADEITLKASDEASKLRQAAIASQEQDARLKDKAVDQLTQPASLQVTISNDGQETDRT